MKLSDFSERRLEIFAQYGKSADDVKNDVQILTDWMKQLHHLPSDDIQGKKLILP